MRNISGPAVWGEDFRFRARELALAEKALLEGNSILLTGLRRIGKSSFLLELERRFRESGAATPCVVDVQDKKTAIGFWDEILRRLPAELVDRFGRSLAGARTIPTRVVEGLRKVLKRGQLSGVTLELKDAVVDYWRPISDALERELSRAEPRVVLLIDELPFFMQNMIEEGYPRSAVNEVLATLRSWRNRQIPTVIAGSISIDALVEELELSSMLLNNLIRLSLRPFSPDESRALLAELVGMSRLTTWTDATYARVLERLDDNFPYFLQCAFQHLRVEDRSDPDYIDRVFQEEIHPSFKKAFYSQFDERLDRLAPAVRRPAIRVLDRLAETPEESLAAREIGALGGEDIDASSLIRRLEIAEFITESGTPGRFQYPFRFLKNWRISRGAGR